MIKKDFTLTFNYKGTIYYIISEKGKLFLDNRLNPDLSDVKFHDMAIGRDVIEKHIAILQAKADGYDGITDFIKI